MTGMLNKGTVDQFKLSFIISECLRFSCAQCSSSLTHLRAGSPSEKKMLLWPPEYRLEQPPRSLIINHVYDQICRLLTHLKSEKASNTSPTHCSWQRKKQGSELFVEDFVFRMNLLTSCVGQWCDSERQQHSVCVETVFIFYVLVFLLRILSALYLCF